MTPVQRKRKTEALLIRKGIPYLSWLPCIEPEEETELRTAEEIGIRIFCLFCVIGTAFDPADSSYKLYLRKQRLWDHLTRNELAFLMNPAPNRELCNNHCWRAEAAFILMWAVGLFERLRFPVRPVANEALVDKLPSFGKSPWPFIHSLKLRPKSQIMDKSDLIYRLHWATRQARLEGLQPPGGLNPDVVYEWHYAINWIVKYNDADWDDVTADT